MLTNEKKNALYECYLSMRQSNSNAVLNCGNGKNVSVAEYNGIYIIRNGTKDPIAYKCGDSPLIYMNAKTIIIEEKPTKFYAIRLLPSSDVKDFDITNKIVHYSCEYVDITSTIAIINQNIVDKYFYMPIYENTDNDFLYKGIITDYILNHFNVTQNVSYVKLSYKHELNYLSTSQHYNIHYAKYQEDTHTIYTNNIVRFLEVINSTKLYIEKHLDKNAINEAAKLRAKVIRDLGLKMNDMPNDELLKLRDKINLL